MRTCILFFWPLNRPIELHHSRRLILGWPSRCGSSIFPLNAVRPAISYSIHIWHITMGPRGTWCYFHILFTICSIYSLEGPTVRLSVFWCQRLSPFKISCWKFIGHTQIYKELKSNSRLRINRVSAPNSQHVFLPHVFRFSTHRFMQIHEYQKLNWNLKQTIGIKYLC